MAIYTVEADYSNRHVLTIEAPDMDTAVQIFYQQGGGDPVDGVGWDNFDVTEHDDDDELADYDESDYDPNGSKIRW